MTWRPQLLEARRAGRRRPSVRRVWAEAGPQRDRGGAYRGGLPPTACYLSYQSRLDDALSMVIPPYSHLVHDHAFVYNKL